MYFRSLPRPLIFILSIFTLTSCLKKDPPQAVQRSANRSMAVVIKHISDRSEAAKSYYQKLLTQAVEQAYFGKIVKIDLDTNEPIQSAQNIYAIASAKVDDLFIFEVNLPPLPWQPQIMPQSIQEARSQKENFAGLSVDVTGSIINGANLKTVGIIRANIPWNFNPEFELAFKEIVKNTALNSLQNPNIYPQSDPLYFGKILFDYSQKNERDSEVALNCETAQEVLATYRQAYKLFLRAKDKINQSVVVGQQGILHDLNTKIEISKDKSEILDKCARDKDLSFSLEIQLENIAPEMRPFIENAVARAKLKEVLSRYTDKPVLLSFRATELGTIDLNVFLRYHPQRYLNWIDGKIPQTYLNYHVVSFDYYYPLMQYLILIKSTLPRSSPQALKNSFRNLEINLNLETLLNGDLRLPVVGFYVASEKRVDLSYPKSVFLSTPGYEPKSILAASDDIFREKGWMSVSSCKTIDGVSTEDGLLMKFLGLDCKI